MTLKGFPGGSVVKNQPAKAGHMALTPGSVRTPEEEKRNPLPYPSLGNHMDRAAWQGYILWDHRSLNNNK